MKVCATCKIGKPLTAFFRKTDARDGRQPHCMACKKGIDAAYRVRSAEHLKAYEKERYLDPVRRAAGRVRLKAKYEATKPEWLAGTRAYALAHPEQVRAAKRKYKVRNPARVLSDTRRRQAGKLNATPKWANQFFIEEIYDLARRRTEATGIKWHVDHVVPLRSKVVCGLHVETNLQVIPADVNYRKGNRVWPGMPDLASVTFAHRQSCDGYGGKSFGPVGIHN